MISYRRHSNVIWPDNNIVISVVLRICVPGCAHHQRSLMAKWQAIIPRPPEILRVSHFLTIISVGGAAVCSGSPRMEADLAVFAVIFNSFWMLFGSADDRVMSCFKAVHTSSPNANASGSNLCIFACNNLLSRIISPSLALIFSA